MGDHMGAKGEYPKAKQRQFQNGKEENMATSDVTMKLLNEVERIRPIIEENATNAEANRQLSSAVYDAMYDAGLFAMLAPKAYGGLELHPVEAMRVWEAVAHTDSAAAWNLVMGQGIAAYAAWLPAERAKELFGDGPATVAGGLRGQVPLNRRRCQCSASGGARPKYPQPIVAPRCSSSALFYGDKTRS
jgi:hypothetical protein